MLNFFYDQDQIESNSLPVKVQSNIWYYEKMSGRKKTDSSIFNPSTYKPEYGLGDMP